MPESVTKILSSLNFESGSIMGVPWQAPAIIVLVFLLILTLAQIRRHFVNWSFKGAGFGIFFGFLLAVIIEGFLLVYGKTVLIQALGWKNPPKPVAVALEAGRSELTKVLGMSDENNYQKVLNIIQSLNSTDTEKIKTLICTP